MNALFSGARRGLLVALALLWLIGCAPDFQDDRCQSDQDCFADEVCSIQGLCVFEQPDPDPEPVAPSIDAFAADATEVVAGAEVTLSWEISEVSEASISGGAFSYAIPEGEMESGQVRVEITEDVTFELEARSDGEVTRAQVAVEVLRAPVIRDLIAEPEAVTFGEPITLSWEIERAEEATISWGDDQERALLADQLERGQLELTPTEPTTYTLTASNAAGSDIAEVSVEVAMAPPEILEFSASATSAPAGDPVTLSWRAREAAEIEIEDNRGQLVDTEGSDPTEGAVEVTLERDTSYTLTARNVAGEDVRTVSVTVAVAFQITRFEADPPAVRPGSPTSLRWQVNQAPASFELVDDAGDPVDVGQADPSAGGVLLNPEEETTYTLTVTSEGGQADTAMVTVEMLPLAPAIEEFESSASGVSAGDSVTLSWRTSGADAVAIADDSGDPVDVSGADVAMGSVEVVVDATTTYTLTATNAGGQDVASVAVMVGDPVEVTLMASQNSTLSGDPITLSWTSANATGLTLTSSDGGAVDLSALMIGGDSVEVYPSGDPTTTYTIEAEGFGGPATASVDIAVTPRANIFSFQADPSPLELGQDVTLSWTAEHVTSMTLQAQDSQGTRMIATSGQLDSGSVTDAPTEDTSYTLTAEGMNGEVTNRQLDLVVFEPVSIDSFAASQGQVTAGEPVTLSWTASQTSSVILGDQSTGALIPTTDLGGGAGEAVVFPQRDSTYALFVEGPQGSTDMATVSVDVDAAPVRITEIFVDPVGPDDQLQWVELYNEGSTFVDLSNYTLGAGASEYTETTLALAGTLPPGGCVVVGGPMSSAANASPDFGVAIDFDPDLSGGPAAGVGLFYDQIVTAGAVPVDSIVYGATNTALLDESGAVDTELSPVPAEGGSIERVAPDSDVFRAQTSPSPGRCFTVASLSPAGAPDEASGEVVIAGYGLELELTEIDLGAQADLSCTELGPGEYGCALGPSASTGDVDLVTRRTDEYVPDADGMPVTSALAAPITRTLPAAFTRQGREADPGASFECGLLDPGATPTAPAGSPITVEVQIFAAGSTDAAAGDIPAGWLVEVASMSAGALPYEVVLDWEAANLDRDLGAEVVYAASLTSPVATSAEVAARVSRDGGASYIYCDLMVASMGSEDGWQAGAGLDVQWQ